MDIAFAFISAFDALSAGAQKANRHGKIFQLGQYEEDFALMAAPASLAYACF